MDIYETVLAHKHGELIFPDFAPLQTGTKDIITKLLHPKATRRLGVTKDTDWTKLAFFSGFKWKDLEQGKLKAPVQVPASKNTKPFESKHFTNTYDPRLDDA